MSKLMPTWAIVTAVALLTASSAVAADISCDSFRGLPQFKPELTISANRTLRKASRLTPEIIDFEGTGEIQVLLSRYTKNFRAKAVLRALAANELGVFDVVCEHPFESLGVESPLAGVVMRVPAVRKLRFEVWDYGEGGATGDPPYLIEIRIMSRGSLLLGSQQITASPERKPTCEIVAGPRRQQASLELIRKERLSVLREGHVFVGYAFGGRNLYLRLDEQLPQSDYLTARIFSKSYGEQEFGEICRVNLSTLSSPSDYFLAGVPDERIFNPTWRVEIVAEPGGVSSDSSLSFSIFRDLDPERAEITQAGSSPGAYICVKGFGRGLIPNTASRGFPASSVLVADIDQSAFQLEPLATASIHRMLLNAVAIWRRTCTSCLPENLLFVVLDGALYSMPGAAAALVQPAPVRRGIPRLGDPVLPSLDTSRVGTRTPVQAFERVELNDENMRQLCTMNDGNLSPAARAARENLPCAGRMASNALRLKITPMNTDTSCGPNPDIVACEPDRLSVELSANNYTFRDVDGTPLFGRGRRTADMQTVLLHEIGHWIGLSHTATPQGVMSGSLDHARCVDDAAIEALARISRGQEQPSSGKMSLEYFAGDK